MFVDATVDGAIALDAASAEPATPIARRFVTIGEVGDIASCMPRSWPNTFFARIDQSARRSRSESSPDEYRAAASNSDATSEGYGCKNAMPVES